MIIETRELDTPHGRVRVNVGQEEEAISDPRDLYPSMSDADVAAWRADRWIYVYVSIVDVCVCNAGHEHLGDVRDSLGMIMYGDGEGWSVSMDDLLNVYPVPDMLAGEK